MPVKVRIPTALQKLTKNEGEVQAQGSNVNEVFDDMEGRFPGLKERLYDDSGEIRRFINVYVNDEDIRFLDGGKTSVKEGDEVSIIPAIAGGQPTGRSGGDAPQ
ncbi:MAG: ubiquitin-like small modifier protein 1, partial [bacterium]